MTVRQINFSLGIVAVFTAIGATSLCVAALLMPMPNSTVTSGIVNRSSPTSRPAEVDSMPSAQTIALVADVRLRRSLAEAKSPFAIATTRPATLGLTLRGTIVEPGRSFAVFATASGKVQVCEAGERIDGAEVLAITAVDVTIRVGDRSIVLDVPRTPAAGAFGT